MRIGILASGRGTNLQALLDRCADGSLRAKVAIVGCNRADAQALARCRAIGVPSVVADRAAIPKRRERQAVILKALQASNVDLVVLAGYDEILEPTFVAAFRGRIVNTHPSLLPAFGGTMHAVQQALEAGVKVTGCTVHLVTDEIDAGPIIFQRCVEVHEEDTVESLRERIQSLEHVLVPAAVQAFAEGRVQIYGNRVRMLPERLIASRD